MPPKTEIDLGRLAAEREKYVIDALRLYTKNTGYLYFHTHVPEALSNGNSAWGYLPYPQDTTHRDNDIKRDRDLSRAVSDLQTQGIFEINAQYYYRTHSEFYKLRDFDESDIEFGLFASKRIYRVLVEIFKVKSIRDYKLFGRTRLTKKCKYTNYQGSRWDCKLRGYYYSEIDDLVKYKLITRTKGNIGYRKYTLTKLGEEFMENNMQFLEDEYKH